MGKTLLGLGIGLILGIITIFITQQFVDITDPQAWITFFVVVTLVSAGFETVIRMGSNSEQKENDQA